MKLNLSRLMLAAVPAIGLTMLVGRATYAADIHWTGASGTSANWSDAANWSPTAPGAGDNLVFSGYSQTVNTNNLTDLSSGWLQFANGDFWLYGNPLTVTAVTNLAGANILFMPLTNETAQVWDRAVASSLTLSNTLTLGGTLTLTGDGDSAVVGVVAGTGGVTQNGNGSLSLFAANTFSGGLTINAGLVSGATANGATYGACGNGNVVVNSGGTLRATGDNNSLFGPTSGATRTLRVNSGGAVEITGSLTCHLVALILNGGTITASTANTAWGNWNFDYGVSTLTNGSSSTISGGNVALTQTGGTVFNIGAGDTVAVDSILAHTGSAADLGLIKTGGGTLSLSAVNTYTSPTTIQAGTLQLMGGGIETSPTITIAANAVLNVMNTSFTLGANQALSGSGSVIGSINDNNAGATISPGGNSVAGTLKVDSMTLNGNLALNFDLSTNLTVGGVNDLLIVTNLTLATSATNTVNINFLSGVPAVGTYTLIQYQTGPAAGPITTLVATASRYSYAFSSDGSSIKLSVSGTPASLVWKGDGVSNSWDIVTTKNWLRNGSTLDWFYQADNVVFDNVGSNTPPVYLQAAVQPTTITVNSANNYMFSGPGKISGSTTLIKSGTGTLAINTTNDYAGATTVNDGALNLQSASAVAGPLVLNSGAVNVNVAASLAGQSTVNGGVLTVNVANGSTAPTNTVNRGGNLVFNAGGSSGSAQGTINVNAGGTNTLLAGNAYGYSGTPWVRTLNINGGLVDNLANGDNGWSMTVNLTGGELRANNGIGSSSSGPLFAFGGPAGGVGATINVLASSTPSVISGRINLRENNTTGTITNVLPINVADGAADPDLLVSAAITTSSANYGLSKNGPGTMVFTGPNTYSSVTLINGGTLQIGAGGITGVIGTGNITNNATLIFNRSDALTVSAPIYGTGVVQNVGSGALLLNGTSTYTGPTTVSAGTLQGSGTINSPVTVLSGANLSAGGVLGTGTLTLSNVTVNPGAGLMFDLSSTGATNDLLAVRGTLAFGAPTPVTFNFLGGTPFVGGTYTILTNWISGRGNDLTYINSTRYGVNLDNSQANRVQVTFTGANANLVWKGNVNNLWNLNTDANWLSGGAASTYYQADAVVFDDNGLGQPNISLAGDMIPASVTVNSSANYRFSGGGLGSYGNLTKSGAGTLTLVNSNVFAGTVLHAGTIQVGNGGTTGFLNGNIADYGSLVFMRSDTLTYAGVISGPGTLTQAGSGTLLLTGANTFFGGATVNPGSTVQVGNGAVVDNGVLGIGPVTNLGSIVYNRASAITVAAPHSGNGSLTFLGTGALGQSSYQMNGTNTFTGPVTLSLSRLYSPIGALGFGNPSNIAVQQGSQVYALGTSYSSLFNIPLTLSGTGWRESSGLLGALRLNGGANWAGPITLSGDARVTAYNDGNSNVITGTISGDGYQLEVGASGGTSALLTLAPSGVNAFGSLLVSPGTVMLGNANAVPNNIPLKMNGGTLRLNGNSMSFSDFTSPGGGTIQNFSATTPATITLNPAADVIYGGSFADGGAQPLALVKNGYARLTLSALSTNQGGVTVNGGVLALANGGGNGVVRGTVTMQPGTLLLSLNNDSFGYNGGVSQITTLNLNSATLIHAPANNLTLWNNLVINMTGGYMAATNTATLPSTGSRLDLGAGTSINTLPSAKSSTIGGSNLYFRQTDNVFNVADGSALDDLVISAPINQMASGYGIIKRGAGRMKITGPIALSGALTIDGGSVVLGASSPLTSMVGAISLASGTTLDVSAPGGLTLNDNQVLQGIGTVTGTVTDGNGTVIRPGSAVGTLTVNGRLALNGMGSLALKLANVTTVGGGVNDLIQVNGDLSLNDGAATPVYFSFVNGAPASGTYTIIKYTGNLTGSAAGLVNSAGGAVATFSVDTANKAVQVKFTVPAQNLVWQGGDGQGNNWDFLATSVNWFNGTTDTNFYQLDAVRFDDSRSTVNTLVTIGAAVTPTSMTLDSTNDYSFTGSGKITGVTKVTKNNTNTVTFATANDFTGSIAVNAGVLASGNASGLPNNAVVTIASGAAFNYAADPASTARNYSFTIAGDGPDGIGAIQCSGSAIYGNSSIGMLTLTADASVGGTARWDIGSGATGVVFQANGFNLTKAGANQITFRPESILNASNLVINAGIIQHEGFNRTNAATSSMTNIVNNGATLSSYGTLVFNYPVLFNSGVLANGSGTATWTGPMTLAGNAVVTAANPVNLWGPVSGAGGLLKPGLGILTITNANTYAGGTVISNAMVTITNAAAAGVAAIVASQPNALGSGPVTIDASLVTTNTLTNVVRALEFNVTGGATVPNGINLPVASSLVTNVSIQGRDSTSVFTLSGQIRGGYTGLTNWFDSGTSGSLGVIRLANNANDFVAGGIRVARGTLAITGDGCLGNGANLLRMDQAAGSVTGAALRFDAANLTVSHPIFLASATVFDLFGDNDGNGVAESANNVTLNGILSGAGTIYVRGTNGTLTLSGANTYSGGFEVQQPVTLQVAASANLGTAYLAIKAGSTFRYTGTGSETMTRTAYIDTGAGGGGGTIDIPNASASLTWNPGAGTINQNVTKTGAGSLTLGSLAISGGWLTANGGSLTVNSVISGATVVQVNTGTLTLAGANTYVGPTFVNGGTLFVNGSLPAANAVTVASGATLSGNGTINCPVSLQSGSFLQPGATAGAIGTLTVRGPLALAGSTTMEINGTTGTGDSVAGMSTVTYGGTLTVNNIGAEPAAGTKFVLFSAVDRLGAFSSAPVLPPLSAGKSWFNNLAVDGSIQVVSGVNPTPPTLTNSVSGGQLNLSWPADHIGWRLVVQTNSLNVGLVTNLASWYTWPNSTNVNSVSIPIDPQNPTVFYRLVYP